MHMYIQGPHYTCMCMEPPSYTCIDRVPIICVQGDSIYKCTWGVYQMYIYRDFIICVYMGIPLYVHMKVLLNT